MTDADPSGVNAWWASLSVEERTRLRPHDGQRVQVPGEYHAEPPGPLASPEDRETWAALEGRPIVEEGVFCLPIPPDPDDAEDDQ